MALYLQDPELQRTLDLIMWSLRLPLLRKALVAIGEKHPRPEYADIDLLDALTAESVRLDALITEGERALGILPPERE